MKVLAVINRARRYKKDPRPPGQNRSTTQSSSDENIALIETVTRDPDPSRNTRIAGILGPDSISPTFERKNSSVQLAPEKTELPIRRWASDPSYAAVNGDDILPDFAIGRLPAATVEQVETIGRKDRGEVGS